MSKRAPRHRIVRPLVVVVSLGILACALVYIRSAADRRSAAPELAGWTEDGQEPPAPPRGVVPPSRSRGVDELRAAVKGANVVLCVIDAARADHLGCYGYPRQTTPNIDRLARESFVFDWHFCPFPLTYPSTASLLTSQYPDTHLGYGRRVLDPSTFTMQEGLRAAGFHTALFSANPNVSPAAARARHFEYAGPDGATGWFYSPESLLQPMAEWLGRRPPSPFFVYVHFVPPHKPYEAPESMKQLFAGQDPPTAWVGGFEFPELARPAPGLRGGQRKALKAPAGKSVNPYDANLRWADWAVGEVLDLLEQARVLDETLFIVTSDHGEAFGEHGYTVHGWGVYDELVHIPLLLKFPGDTPRAGHISALTETVDLLPTLFDLLEVPYPPEEVQGVSLAPLLAGDVDRVRDYVFARDDGSPASYLIRDLSNALILYQGGRLRALYDLAADPRQSRNIIDLEPDRASEMIRAFREFAKQQRLPPLEFSDPGVVPSPPPAAPEIEFSEEERRQLEALGYIE